jgi:hypothetical protein
LAEVFYIKSQAEALSGNIDAAIASLVKSGIKMIAMNKSNLISKFLKILNHFVSGFLIIAGIASITNSLFGGLILVLSGLLFSVIIKDIINKKLFNNNLKSFKVFNIILFILFIAGTAIINSGASEKRLIKDWDDNKDKIVLGISKQIVDGDLSSANRDLERYEVAAKEDPKFASLKEKYQIALNAKAAKEKKIADAKAAEEKKMAEEQIEANKSETQATNINSKYTRNKYTDNDASNVAFCFAFLEVAKKPYLEKTHRLYVQDNEAVFFEEVQPALNKLVQCSGPNAPDQSAIEACIAQLPKEAPLIDGFMRGSNVALHGDATEKTISSAACMGLDAATR